ncbi:MAG: hypothetical protein JW818_18190 [Pirellulales bacterium]|nr:hypothetical protein [Pirellulales bacterium]
MSKQDTSDLQSVPRDVRQPAADPNGPPMPVVGKPAHAKQIHSRLWALAGGTTLVFLSGCASMMATGSTVRVSPLDFMRYRQTRFQDPGTSETAPSSIEHDNTIDH